MKNKMNALYKISFIFSLACVPLLITAIIIAYLLGNVELSIYFSAGGALIAFAGIILGLLSKPRPDKFDKAKKSIDTKDE